MAEKRKPVYIILLRKAGKKSNKVEIFSGKDWGESERLFRLRINGKWWPANELKFWYHSKIKNLVFNAAKF